VVAKLDRDRYDVALIGITKDGAWVLPGAEALEEGLAADAPGALLPLDYGDRRLMRRAADGGLSPVCELDVVFPVLHGPFGEDGTVQGLLELSGIPYVGAGVLGSAAGMDKEIMKKLFEAEGLRTAAALTATREECLEAPEGVSARIEAAFGYPCFVKPANMGSSVGITKVHGKDELAAALAEAAQYDRKVLVEQSIEDAREIECSVLGNDQPVASVPGEVVPSQEFYSYEAKYVSDDSVLTIPAELSPEVAERVRAMAVQAFQAVDGAGLARVDFLVQRGTDDVLVNEVNTLPGFTRISMYPKLWEASGLPYAELLDRLIVLAMERAVAKASLRTSYV
jgi:D-alanine-D-alanine ligase